MKLKVGLLLTILSLIFLVNAEAKMRKYSYPYDISQLEWQLLNWTAAWRGTTTPADPFTLDRLECDRNGWIVNVYLTGSADQATDENLKKSVDGIISVFKDRFADFVPEEDLVVHFNLKSANGQSVYKEYNKGDFSNGQVSGGDSMSGSNSKTSLSY